MTASIIAELSCPSFAAELNSTEAEIQTISVPAAGPVEQMDSIIQCSPLYSSSRYVKARFSSPDSKSILDRFHFLRNKITKR